MILKDFIKNSGVNQVYINDAKKSLHSVDIFDLSYPPDTHRLKRYLDYYGHSEVIYGIISKNLDTVYAHI